MRGLRIFALTAGLLSFAPLAHAAKVIYIGGVGSQKAAIQPCYPNFENYSLTQGRQLVQSLVRKINANPKTKYVIVGHSSGAAPAESIARQVKDKNQIKLIELDGIASYSVQASLPNSSCWYSVGKKMKSRNAASMMRCKHPNKISAPTCHTQWCLHFALVNQRTPANLNGHTFIGHGYDNCRGNTAWLK